MLISTLWPNYLIWNKLENEMWVNQQIFHISIKCYSCSCEHVWDKCSCLETIFAIKKIHCSVQETEIWAIISKVRQSSKMLMKCDLWVCQANKMWNMMRVSVFEQLRQKSITALIRAGWHWRGIWQVVTQTSNSALEGIIENDCWVK